MYINSKNQEQRLKPGDLFGIKANSKYTCGITYPKASFFNPEKFGYFHPISIYYIQYILDEKIISIFNQINNFPFIFRYEGKGICEEIISKKKFSFYDSDVHKGLYHSKLYFNNVKDTNDNFMEEFNYLLNNPLCFSCEDGDLHIITEEFKKEYNEKCIGHEDEIINLINELEKISKKEFIKSVQDNITNHLIEIKKGKMKELQAITDTEDLINKCSQKVNKIIL